MHFRHPFLIISRRDNSPRLNDNRKKEIEMQLLKEILIELDNMQCNTCKLKNQCDKMKEENNKTLCAYLWELDEKIFFNKNNE